MSRRDSDQQWERYGRTDPYFGVLSHEKFRGEPGASERDEFFASGEKQIAFVLSIARERFDPGFEPSRALDFGCGVGRCTLPLARRCGSVVGIDVSESMLEEARRNCAAASLEGVVFQRSDDTLSDVPGSFDLVHSVLVFQHIARKRGERIFSTLVDRLSDGGVGAVQFVYHRTDSRGVRLLGTLRREVPLVHNLVNLAYGRPFSDPLMEKNVYDVNRLLWILQEHGCDEVYGRFLGRGKLRSVVLFFRKGSLETPVDHYD